MNCVKQGILICQCNTQIIPGYDYVNHIDYLNWVDLADLTWPELTWLDLSWLDLPWLLDPNEPSITIWQVYMIDMNVTYMCLTSNHYRVGMKKQLELTVNHRRLLDRWKGCWRWGRWRWWMVGSKCMNMRFIIHAETAWKGGSWQGSKHYLEFEFVLLVLPSVQ